MSKVGAIVASAAALSLAVCVPPAEAQNAFFEAVRELVETASVADGTATADLLPRRTAALARMKTALAEWDRHIEALESRVARDLRDATVERVFQLHVELGLAYRQRGRLDDALREFDEAATAQPAASDVHVLRALTLDAAGKNADAGRAFRMAWLRDTENPVKAYLALMAGSEPPRTGPRASGLDDAERTRARMVLRDAFERTLAADTQARGAAFFVLDPIPDSLSRAPAVADALTADVFAQLADGKLDAALATWSADRTAVPAHGNAPAAHFERGRAAEIQGRYADARRAYMAALGGTLAGRHVLHVGIGRIAMVEGELDAAIEAFGHAVRLHPNDPVIHRELAGAYAAAGRSDEAFAELVAALLIDPRDVAAMAAVGQLFLDADRATDAIAVLTRALELNPDRLETRYALAVALTRAGRAEEAGRRFAEFERMSRQASDERRREVTGQAGPNDAAR